ncbi:MAG: hypothetical protein M1820_001368 [Bogoriella megaspora]|nr:MAG: hypothetical protein M1820_001368 [Bogoriella megaspora]
MPFRPEQSLLSIDTPKIHTIDTHNVQDLFGIWSVFSKCSEVMENGKRLENLAWRLWNRETFCCAPEQQAQSRSCPHFFRERAQKDEEMSTPALSSSLDSDDSSDGSVASSFLTSSAIDCSRPELRRHDSTESWSRGTEKHISPIDLEKIICSIEEKTELEPLSPLPQRSSHTAVHLADSNDESQAHVQSRDSPHAEDRTPRSNSPHALGPELSMSTVASTVPTTINSNSSSESTPLNSRDSDSTTDMSSHSIVRGFSVGQISSSYRSQSQVQISPAPVPILRKSKPKGAKFQIGAGSSDEPESSLDTHMSNAPRSSLSEGLKQPSSSKKQTSFRDEVDIRTMCHKAVEENEDVFESDDEDEEEVSESAIDDDEEEDDWEDEGEDSGPSSVDEKFHFQRVESKPNLVSRRSLLTTMIHEPERAAALQNAASRSTPALRRSRTSTPNGPSLAASPDDDEPGLEMKGKQIPSSKPIIMTTSNTHQPALSPRTTRRNMLSTELTESLRKNLLWERQHKNGNKAGLTRRHTSYDVKNLQQFPGEQKIQTEKGPVMNKKASDYQSWNDYFDQGLSDFHRKGW